MPDAAPLQPSTKLQLLAQALREMGLLPQPGAQPTPATVGSGIAAQGAGLLQNRGTQINQQVAANGG